MILLNDVAKAGPFMVVYKDHSDPKLFYYIPRFAELAKRDDGNLIFGHQLFRRNMTDPLDGYSVYNFTVRSVLPGAEMEATKRELEARVGSGISIVPIPGFDITGDSITDLSVFQIGGRVQARGGNLFTDLGVSFTFREDCEPDMSNLFKSNNGWTGSINYKLTGLTTPFEATIKVNWKAVQDHFRAQVSVKHWFINTNISYETQKLIENGTIDVEIIGGTPEEKDKIWAMANKLAERLFVRTLQPNPLPGHPSGGIVSFSLNYSRVEENRRVEFHLVQRDIENRSLGMAIVVGNVPNSYFPSIGNPIKLSNDLSLESQIENEMKKQGILYL